MAGSGLLNRARDFHEKASGISAEDRREILARIDELTKKNRLEGKKLSFQARSRGILFPVLVNLAAAALTAGGLWALSVAFREREAAATVEGAALSTAEGKLIRELKRDAESKLGEKEKEIADMQERIAALDADRANLQTSFESRVSAKETELREQMRIELERERQRLIAEGLSEAAVRERLKRFEEERLAALRAEMAAFQRKIDEERAAADANYAKLRDEYRAGMASLNEERKRIQDESRRREDALRASMEAKTRELKQESAVAAEEREKAQAALARAEEERAAREAAEERVVGLYLAVRSAVQERRFEEAATRAAALKAYLDDPSLAAAARPRRQADLFAAEALSFMARTELERASLDNSLLLRQAELVSAVRGAAERARNALKAGNAAAGEEAYRDALRAIPEILEAHGYFTERAREAEKKRVEQALLRSAEASRALDRGEYEAASGAYRAAAAELLGDEAAAEALARGIARLGSLEDRRAKTESDTKAAQTPLARAFSDLQTGKWSAAASAFAAAVAAYPSAKQVPDALAGIDAALAGAARSAAARTEADRARIGELEADAKRLAAELTESRAAGEAERTALAAEYEARAAELQRLLDEARAETAAAAARAAGAAGTAEAAPGNDGAAELAKLREENLRLASAAARYDSLVASYRGYQEAEDAARLSGGAGSLVESRSRFDAFLDDEQTRNAFPDLRERIARYEREYAAAGQTESLYNAIDAAEGALALTDAAARERYFAGLRERFKDDQAMLDYIDTLGRGLR